MKCFEKEETFETPKEIFLLPLLGFRDFFFFFFFFNFLNFVINFLEIFFTATGISRFFFFFFFAIFEILKSNFLKFFDQILHKNLFDDNYNFLIIFEQEAKKKTKKN